MFEQFTDRSRRVVVLAQEEARMLGHDYIGTEHLLLGLIHEGSGVAAGLLGSAGVTIEAARAAVLEVVSTGDNPRSGYIPFTPRAKKVLELSMREALELKQSYIKTEHLLLGLIREGSGVGVQVLDRLAGPLPALRHQVIMAARAAAPLPAAEQETAGASSVSARNANWRADRARSRSITEFRDLLQSLDRRVAAVERHLGLPTVDPEASIEDRVDTVERHLGLSAGESSGPGAPAEPGQSPAADE
jgi:ATP-dependent Clp protease ATP-binding subunit ClpA